MSEQNTVPESHSTTSPTSPPQPSLAFFPVTLFGSIMGYAGLTLAFITLSDILGLSPVIPTTLTVLTTLFFAIISLTYLIKIIKLPQAMIKEFNHPVAINFFPAFSISLILLGVIFGRYDPLIGQIFWTLGASLQLILTIIIISNWIHHEKWQITHMSPAWFIPVVGNIIVPLGTPLYAPIELGWFFFSIGIVFWILLQAIVMYRLFFHPPMLKTLEPTLFIFIAPPAIGFSSYLQITGGELDSFARVLYYTALFFALLLFVQAPRFLRVPFSLSWWAYTFPLAALALATAKMFALTGLGIFSILMSLFTAIVAALIFHLTLKTLKAAWHRQLCLPPKS